VSNIEQAADPYFHLQLTPHLKIVSRPERCPSNF
jgi:hypothetical protein